MMKQILLYSIVTLFMVAGCSRAHPEPEGNAAATSLAENVSALLPPGWKPLPCQVDSAPSGWSGHTTAVSIGFEHESLKFRNDGSSPARFRLWRTPIDYSGKELPSDLDQPGGAWLLGTSEKYRWFIAGLLPEEKEWKPIKDSLYRRFSINPEQ